MEDVYVASIGDAYAGSTELIKDHTDLEMLNKKYSLFLPKLLIYGNERASTVVHFCSKIRMP